jgi:hypothetical protein
VREVDAAALGRDRQLPRGTEVAECLRVLDENAPLVCLNMSGGPMRRSARSNAAAVERRVAAWALAPVACGDGAARRLVIFRTRLQCGFA